MMLLVLSTGVPTPSADAAPQASRAQTTKVKGAKSKKLLKRKRPAKRAKVTRSTARKIKKSGINAAFLKRLPDWSWVVRGAVALGALGLLWSWRRKDQLASSPERDMRVVARARPFGAHVPRAVVLNHAASPDPSTMMQDDTIDQWGVPKPVNAEPDNARAAADLDAIVTSIHLQSQGGYDASVQPRRQSGLALPVELARHFEGQPGETLIWSAPFNVPLYASGTVAVTSQRVLSLYRKHQWQFFPPGFEVQVRRHQMHRGRDLRAEQTTVRRPSLLVAALICVAWFPVGTGMAGIAVALHLLAGRRELMLMHKQIKRLYPLAPADIETAIAACRQNNVDQQNSGVAEAPPQAS